MHICIDEYRKHCTSIQPNEIHKPSRSNKHLESQHLAAADATFSKTPDANVLFAPGSMLLISKNLELAQALRHIPGWFLNCHWEPSGFPERNARNLMPFLLKRFTGTLQSKACRALAPGLRALNSHSEPAQERSSHINIFKGAVDP